MVLPSLFCQNLVLQNVAPPNMVKIPFNINGITLVQGYVTKLPSMQRKCLPATWKYLHRTVGGVTTGRVAFTENQTTR